MITSRVGMASPRGSSDIRVAVTQAEPIWLNLDATIAKTCKLIEEAAQHGAKLITFPECWVPGYPAWVWYVWPSRDVIVDG
jgi:nitrilase